MIVWQSSAFKERVVKIWLIKMVACFAQIITSKVVN